MGSTNREVLDNIRKTLEPYVRPRDEVGRIRQILAAHLDSYLDDGAAVDPLALVGANGVKPSPAARGLQQEYLEALNANIKARREFAACREQTRLEAEPAGRNRGEGVGHLQEHLAAIQLWQRREKLQAIEGCLSSLAQKPAASPGFLDAKEIFKDSRALPDVPKDLMTALAVDNTAGRPQLKDLVDRLEKHVLQTKLLLAREEQLLEKVKARSTARPDSVTESAKLEALNKTRLELISWMEAELSKAAGDDGDAEAQDGQKHRPPAQSINMDEQLASIQEKYAQYIDARKTVLRLVSEQPQPSIKPPPTERKTSSVPAHNAPPTTHLVSPYLEKLLALSREQKGLIAQKSHISAAISKQLKENLHLLDHLAEESQLIPAYPVAGVPRTDAAFADATSSTGGSDPSTRVRPWVLAADSAKIATLEAVAEKIEEGQVAFEGSMETLGELEQLSGQRPDTVKQEEISNDGEEDLWLSESRPAGRGAGARKHTIGKADAPAQPKTIWDTLDGSLGLLRAERDTP